MGGTKDLQVLPVIEKLKELSEDAKLCMFCTAMNELPFNTRPMATQQVDDDGIEGDRRI